MSKRPFDLVVRSGTVVTENEVVSADIGIVGGVISDIAEGLPSGTRDIDASDAIVLPGGVDAHTHLNSRWPPFDDPRRPVDDFFHGSRTALAGGVTTVCDFVYRLENLSLEDSIAVIREEAETHSSVDVALHLVIELAEPDLAMRIPEIVDSGYPSFKFYTNSDDFVENCPPYLDILEAIGKAGGIALFHCEDHAIEQYCGDKLIRAGRTAVRHYPASKPPEVELAASERVLHMAAVTGVPAYLVHVSLASVLEDALAARANGQEVYVETRPLYLYLTDELYDQTEREAAKYVGTPPLRKQSDVDRIWAGLAAGEVDVVATDHVGFAMAEKHRCGDTFRNVPSGMANLGTVIPMLFSEGVLKGRLTLSQLACLVATNPAKILNLFPKKGAIAPGADADLCVIDPKLTKTLPTSPVYSASDFEVYEGFEITGWPRFTIARGEVAYAEGQVQAQRGSGRVVLRPAPESRDAAGIEPVRRTA